MGKVISVVGRKGGCGKTSTTILLGQAGLALGLRVMLIDGNSDEQSLWRAARMHRGGVLSAIVHEAKESNFAEFAEQVELASKFYDLVVIDTPPGNVELSLWAMQVCQAIVLPFGADLDEAISQAEYYEGAIRGIVDVPVFSSMNRSTASKESGRVRDFQANKFPVDSALPELPACEPFKMAKNSGCTLSEFAVRNKYTRQLEERAEGCVEMIFKRLGVSIDG